jgi:hypothetical protein
VRDKLPSLLGDVAYLVNFLSPKEQFGGKERIISYNYQQASGIIIHQQYKE